MTAAIQVQTPQIGAGLQLPLGSRGLGPEAQMIVRVTSPVLASPGSQSAVPQEWTLANAAFDLKVFFSQFSMHLSPQWREGLFRQLDEILDCETWEEDEKLPDSAGWKTLLRLVIYYKFKVRPGLGFREGHPLIMWTNEDTRITLECRSADKIHWVASRRVDQEMDIAAGESTISMLRDHLTAFNTNSWLIDGDRNAG